MITRKMIEDLFDRTRQLHAEGRVSWDIDEVSRWSYFFVDASRDKLLAAGELLEREGYEFVGLLEPIPEDEDQATIYLRVDQIEKHSVGSLLSRNAELYGIAEQLDLQGYDGMDVGGLDGH